MKLLLSGGGDPEQIKALDEYFADYVKDDKILYIPVAMEKYHIMNAKNGLEKHMLNII